MKIFTVAGSQNFIGAEVSFMPNYDSGIQGLIVGNETNGCKLGVVKLSLGTEKKTLLHCEVIEGKTPYIKPTNSSKDDSSALVVFRTPVFKGGRNFHTGDKTHGACFNCEVEFDKMVDLCNYCGRKLKVYYKDFPGRTIARGTVRNSKKPVFGDQLICIVKKGIIFRTSYNGYLYPHPGAHFHVFDGTRIVTANWDERKKGYLR
jgi:hypothetical protein